MNDIIRLFIAFHNSLNKFDLKESDSATRLGNEVNKTFSFFRLKLFN
jgi:hypothetical protein